MRVLGVFSTDQLVGGGEISFLLSLRGLKDAGCEVIAMLPGQGPLSKRLSDEDIPFEIAPQETLRRGGSVHFLLRPHPAWAEVVRRVHPDIIHCNAIRSALYGQAVGRALSIPTVFHARIAQTDPPFDHFLLATVRAIVCASETIKMRFPSWLGAGKLKVIPNAIDPAFLSAARRGTHFRDQWLDGSSGPLIGVIGRLSPDKGQHHLIRAAAELLREIPSCRFVLIGDEDPSNPGYMSELRQLARNLGCEAAVTFAGFVEDMRSAYDALDIVAFPSASEGFGRIVIEAGAVGKPVIASDLPAIRELVPNELQGHLLADPDNLATRLKPLIENRVLRERIGANLKDHVLSRFTLDRHVSLLMELYRGLAGR
jgi:glycosyltransferase involved in cell wall biosynthesis